jgi:hypothetical protein
VIWLSRDARPLALSATLVVWPAVSAPELGAMLSLPSRLPDSETDQFTGPPEAEMVMEPPSSGLSTIVVGDTVTVPCLGGGGEVGVGLALELLADGAGEVGDGLLPGGGALVEGAGAVDEGDGPTVGDGATLAVGPPLPPPPAAGDGDRCPPPLPGAVGPADCPGLPGRPAAALDGAPTVPVPVLPAPTDV